MCQWQGRCIFPFSEGKACFELFSIGYIRISKNIEQALKMRRLSLVSLLFILLSTLAGCGPRSTVSSEEIVKIEMNLSAFGVESDFVPSIDAVIDFSKDTSICVKTYYNPAFKGSSYALNESEMTEILGLLKITDLKKLKTEYRVPMSDLPTSKTVIYTTKSKYTILDYGMEGEKPLKELYKIVYKY